MGYQYWPNLFQRSNHITPSEHGFKLNFGLANLETTSSYSSGVNGSMGYSWYALNDKHNMKLQYILTLEMRNLA